MHILTLILVITFNLIQYTQSSERCSYYPYGTSYKYTTICSERCCQASYPRTVSEACCQNSSFDWWWYLIIGILLVCCLPCIIVAVVVVCYKSKKKGRVVNMVPAPAMQNSSTTIHIKTDPMPPAYMANNLNQQNGMYQPVNPTYNSMAHPVNNTNFSSNLGQNGDQIFPILPPSTNPQMVNQSYQAYA